MKKFNLSHAMFNPASFTLYQDRVALGRPAHPPRHPDDHLAGPGQLPSLGKARFNRPGQERRHPTIPSGFSSYHKALPSEAKYALVAK